MKYLISEDFKRKLDGFPDRARSDAIVSKLSDFCMKLAEVKGKFRNLPKGFWVRSIKGTRILKFRVNSGDRILFTLYSMVADGHRDEFADSVIFIDYCTHDEQIRKGLRVSDDFNPELLEIDTTPFAEEIDGIEPSQESSSWSRAWSSCSYDLNNSVTYVLDDNHLAALTEKENKDWIFYLNDKQYQCLRHIKSPLLLRGSAGSGKTTVALHKLLASSFGEKRVAYFTYTKYLLDNAQSLYNRYKDKSANAEFYRITEYCELILDITGKRTVNFEKFCTWFTDNIFRFKYFEGFDPVDIWAEIRGIVKGFMGISWNRNMGMPLLDKRDYLDLSDKYSVFSTEQRESIYSISLLYQGWLDASYMLDENDLARQAYLNIRDIGSSLFDFIVVDEAQDLTELQLFLLLKLVSEPGCIFISGDEHQMVNPTYFGFHRIGAYFTEAGLSHELVSLQQNYRSQNKIVDLANRMIELRRTYIGATNCDYHESFVREGNKPFLVSNNKKTLEQLISAANERHYCIIITADDEEKQKIKSLLGENSRVFTVTEIKGLEYPYIICCNLLSRSRNYWNDIFQRRGRRDARYRYFFNSFYVAITRARENLCIYEDDEDTPLFTFLNDVFEPVEIFDEHRLRLMRFSNAAEWLRDAEELEAKEKFEQAIGSYQQANDERGVARCRGKLLARSGKFSEAGDVLMKAGMFQDAREYYHSAGDEYNSLKCRIWSGEPFHSVSENGYSLQQQISMFLKNHKDGEGFEPFIEYIDAIVCGKIESQKTQFTYLLELADIIGENKR